MNEPVASGERNISRVEDVESGSLAWKAGINEGDIIISVNHKKLRDVFDYQFMMNRKKVKLKVKKRDGSLEKITIHKEPYEDIGLSFDDDLMNSEKSCNNKCIFCFIDQLPPGMRKTLYYKDDDARLSLLHGNYVTLTNTGMHELKRLAKRRVSPINISVHTSNPELRVKMMSNRFAGDIMEKIEFLAKKRITMNCQIVLCRGYNDGEEMIRTAEDLFKYHPRVKSLSVVPVGLTKYRSNLPALKEFDKQSSQEVLETVTTLQKKFKGESGCNFIYPADEFYIMTEDEPPGPDQYDGYPQLENGVGLMTSFLDEVLDALDKEKDFETEEKTVSIATGTAAYGFMNKIVEKTGEKFKNIKFNVFRIENEFFGKKITVAGLLTARDMIKTLKEEELGDVLMIPCVMLKADEDMFLDDVTLGEFADELGVRVEPVYVSGYDFIDKIAGRYGDG